MTKAVIDTNVVVSSVIQPLGHPAAVLDLVSAGAVELVVNDAIIAEYAEVLARPKFQFPKNVVDGMVGYLSAKGTHCLALPQGEATPDPKDQVFWDLAASNNAILITGNVRHFPASERVMTPARFMQRMREGA